MIRSNFWNPPLFRTLPDIQMVVKAADETVNNSNVLQDDDELLFPIGANEVWHIHALLRLIQDNAAADWKLTFTAPAGASGGEKLITGMAGGEAWSALGTALLALNGLTSETPCYLDALVVNGAVSGAVTLQWSQNTATVADNKILANSFLIATRLA